MFMFWSKRTVLTKRLLKAKVRGEHETECEAQEDSSRIHRTSNTSGVAGGYDTSSNNNNNNNNNATAGRVSRRSAVRGGAAAALSAGAGYGRITTTTATTTTTTTSSSTSRLHQGCCGGDSSQDDDEDPSRLMRCKELLKTLKENQLEMLLSAVESYGADLGSCILVPRQQRGLDDHHRSTYDHQQHEQQQQYGGRPHRHHPRHFHHQRYRHYRHHRSRHHRSSSIEDEQESCSEESTSPMRSADERYCGKAGSAVGSGVVPVRGGGPSAAESSAPSDPHLLCCQIWRWPDLEHSSELKRLPICHSAKDPVYICCNPYHWSRLCKPESPPPPYCLITDRLRPEGETGQREWCTLAYWELGGRVGRLYPVEPSTVNVFDSLHDGDGLCLATLAENHIAPPAVQRTRSKIGLGLTLSQEADGVWAYNRSESPIFVNSPTLDDPESRTLLVYRVPPGFCLNIFDRAKILQLPYGGGGGGAGAGGFASGPVDINSVRISFAKGWGPKYSRQEVTSCPCWLEVHLAPCR
ncbi:PREDICTED: mothers against decapentaplegic homolog 6 isoform X2 [Dinoponera quadriceps]|uniref:Mothers against decapentaplegic homolog n=1 Tax=Dinoponera quadriceps TaxID=609295 RepID=A0A6P3YBP9_DINQU|nr:PREDICTED: mothers against decapentaplegic homolog 6 isoform X2 [Dinoponera quadriceps]